MNSGKFHKKAVVLCETCISFYELCDTTLSLQGKKSENKYDVPDFLSGLFGKKK